MPYPLVSIILPTYNRARFLPQAFESVRSQTLTDWELIVIDDGSTDETPQLVRELSSGPQPVQYIRQENRGPGAARNTGLERATGSYIAFFDSDDSWLPHHLSRCVRALEANPDVDWVYAACRMIHYAMGSVISESTFYVNGFPRPFLRLHTRDVGKLRVFADARLTRCSIEHGLFCGLQCSVIRLSVFQSLRIPSFRVGEDRVLPVLAVKKGFSMAYFDDVHVLYRVHDANTSNAAGEEDVQRQAQNLSELIRAYESLKAEATLSSGERRSVCRRLNQECFWHLGYATLWQAGRRTAALEMFRRGLWYWPWDWRCWKTYAVAMLRNCLRFQVGNP